MKLFDKDFDLHPLVPILGILGPALIAGGAQIANPPAQAICQVLGIVCVGLAGHALPQPQWAIGKPVVPAAAIALATPLVGVLYQLAAAQPAGVTQTLLYGACCAVSFLAGLHAPPALAPAVQAVKGLFVALALSWALLGASPARAQPILSAGPTLPMLEFRPSDPHPVNLAAGAGAQVGLTLPELQRVMFGKNWDLLDLDLMAFGSAVSSSSGQTFGVLSAAGGLCTMSSMVCLGVGHDVLTSSGVLGGGWFGLLAFSFNLALAPELPPAGSPSWDGKAGIERGNHLYFGNP